MSDFLTRLHQAKNFRDVMELFSWKSIRYIAVFPLLLYMLMPAIVFVRYIFNDGWHYAMSANVAAQLTVEFGFLTMFLGIAKRLSGGISLRRILSDHRPQLWFLALAFLMLLSTAVNGFTPVALYGDEYRLESVFTFMSYGLFVYGCAAMADSEKLKKLLFSAYLLGGAFVSAFALLDAAGVVPIWHFHTIQWEHTLTADFHQYNHYAYYLMIAVMLSFALFLYEKNRILRLLWLGSLFLQTYTLVLNGTRGCYLACLAGLGVTWLLLHFTDRARCKLFWIAIAVFLTATLFSTLSSPSNFTRFMRLFNDAYNIISQSDEAEYAGSHRWTLWKLTLGYIAQKPLLGWGTEGIAQMLYSDSGNDNIRPHCEYLQYAVFYGIPAGLVYIGALVSVFRRAIRQRSELQPMAVIALLAAFTYLVSAIFGNTMYYTAPYLFILLGLGFQSGLKAVDEKA